MLSGPMLLAVFMTGIPVPGRPIALPTLGVQAGGEWKLQLDDQGRHAAFLHGRSQPLAQGLRTETEAVARARFCLQVARASLGVDLSTLELDSVHLLPLRAIGSSDKWTVRFVQVLGGVAVRGGYANVLLDVQGALLSLDSSAIPDVQDRNWSPEIAASAARELALAAFLAQTGHPGFVTSRPVLTVLQQPTPAGRQPRLAWELTLQDDANSSAEEAWTYRVDAEDGQVIERESAIHYFDVSGSVSSLITPGVLPDEASNPPVNTPLGRVEINAGAFSAVSGDDGSFTLVGASASVANPLTVTIRYRGPQADIESTPAGSEYVVTRALTQASGNTIVMNGAASPTVTAQANAFYWINQVGSWIEATNPLDATYAFQALAKVNITGTGSICNALFNGTQMRFRGAEPGCNNLGVPDCTGGATGSCTNKANATVVCHEFGHWLNRQYNGTHLEPAFDEGNADVWALYVTDQPSMGARWCGTVPCIRSGNNTLQHCGDATPNCYAGSHENGKVLMGALWKVRVALVATYGAGGKQIANGLFNAWMLAYDDARIRSVIETHWLVLDDDDGNLANGTPHSSEILSGFTQQGF